MEEIAGKAGSQAKSLAKDNNNDKDDSTLNNGVNGADDFSSVDAAMSHGDLQQQGSGDAL